jgi:Spy/CpxP family protein refolding chaperone
MKELRTAQHQRVLALLTPEQRTQWEALKAERQAKRGDRGNRGTSF